MKRITCCILTVCLICVSFAGCEKAKAVDTKDPYATYAAAKSLAEAYDRVIAAIGI